MVQAEDDGVRAQVAPDTPRFATEDVDARHLPLLARCLTGPVLRHLHERGHSEFLAEVFRRARVEEHLGSRTSLLAAIQAIFDLVRVRYRSDYVYRTAIANKIFLGRHSPATTTLLSELRVWRSRADLVMLNGTSTVYEIKTELDNFDRLAPQIEAYAKMFDQIYVVSNASQLPTLCNVLPAFVGVLSLSDSFTLQVVREGASNAANIDVRTVLDALRRSEVVDLTRRICGHVPQVSGVQLIGECTRLLLAQNSPCRVHDEMVGVLKKRRAFTREDFHHVPRELVPAYMDSGVRAREWPRVTDFLIHTPITEAVR